MEQTDISEERLTELAGIFQEVYGDEVAEVRIVPGGLTSIGWGLSPENKRLRLRMPVWMVHTITPDAARAAAYHVANSINESTSAEYHLTADELCISDELRDAEDDYMLNVWEDRTANRYFVFEIKDTMKYYSEARAAEVFPGQVMRSFISETCTSAPLNDVVANVKVGYSDSLFDSIPVWASGVFNTIVLNSDFDSPDIGEDSPGLKLALLRGLQTIFKWRSGHGDANAGVFMKQIEDLLAANKQFEELYPMYDW